jgi:hypothetical protein
MTSIFYYPVGRLDIGHPRKGEHNNSFSLRMVMTQSLKWQEEKKKLHRMYNVPRADVCQLKL